MWWKFWKFDWGKTSMRSKWKDFLSHPQNLIAVSGIFLTFVLVIITGIYAIQTGELNKITFEQFESENRPYLTIENLIFERSEFGLPGYVITIENRGNSPARLNSVEIRSTTTKDYLLKKDYLEIWLFPEEKITVNWGNFLNLRGGFEFSENVSNFARVKIDYLWNEQKYETTRDFYNYSYSKEIISPDWGEKIFFEKGGQILDKDAPFGQALWSTRFKIEDK